MAGFATAQAQTLEDIGRRLAAAEARLAPLDSAPADIEALSRIVRRELDAVTTDTQARDQMLRRALQQEIDRLNAASEAREQVATDVVARLAQVEGRLTAGAERLDAVDGRLASSDGLAPQIEELRELVRTELEQLRTDAKAHDQVIGEITRRSAALDGRLARVDPLPGELQSLRTALRQEAERSVSQLRAVEERLAQLAWVPGEFQEARKRILAVTSGLQVNQDAVRAVEASLASTNERVKAMGAVPDPTPPNR
jgi:DNA repair exonuclease SbcCD ATPase subunit